MMFYLECEKQSRQEKFPPVTNFADGSQRTIPLFEDFVHLSLGRILIAMPDIVYLPHIRRWLDDYYKRKPYKFNSLYLVILTLENQERPMLIASLYYRKGEHSCSGYPYRIELRSLSDSYYQSPEWLELAKQTKERDGNRCVICNDGSMLHAHHRTYENFGGESPNDLITLCRGCHFLFHKRRQKTHRIKMPKWQGS